MKKYVLEHKMFNVLFAVMIIAIGLIQLTYRNAEKSFFAFLLANMIGRSGMLISMTLISMIICKEVLNGEKRIDAIIVSFCSAYVCGCVIDIMFYYVLGQVNKYNFLCYLYHDMLGAPGVIWILYVLVIVWYGMKICCRIKTEEMQKQMRKIGGGRRLSIINFLGYRSVQS